MTPTHYLPVTAWRYDPVGRIPIWAARKWHRLGQEAKLETTDGDVCREGQWIVAWDLKELAAGRPAFTVFTHEEFTAVFIPLPV